MTGKTLQSKAPAATGKEQETMSRMHNVMPIMGLAVAIYIAMILATYSKSDPSFNNTFDGKEFENLGGRVGAHLSDLLLSGLGLSAFLIIPLTLLGCILLYRKKGASAAVTVSERISTVMGFMLFLFASAALETLRFHGHSVELPSDPGGVIGYGIAKMFISTVGFQGGTLFIIAIWLSGFFLFTSLSPVETLRITGAWVLNLHVQMIKAISKQAAQAAKERQQKMEKSEEPQISAPQRPPVPERRIEPVITSISPPTVPDPEPSQSPRSKRRKATPGKYNLTPDELLAPATDQSEKIPDTETLAEKSGLIESRLNDFGVEVKVVGAHSGPVVTRFEIEPSLGVKGSQILNLSKDLARSLSVHSIRVLETIQGKTTMGLEIPNSDRQIVYLSEILKSPEFTDMPSPLSIALGKNISGYPAVTDLKSTPHLLVAGTTGSGKSVSVNAMILSLLFKSSPREVKMIMIDPKMLELSVYEGIPHLLAPVVTDVQNSQTALEWCVGEMERRYRLMASFGVRNLDNMNEMIAKKQAKGEKILNPQGEEGEELDALPYIVVIVDELADLMMVVGKKIEGLISRLAQKARASGIHLILATQRPSVDVITGLIKANIPSRIAFQVSSKVDSRTILDQMGAETLLGRGDMLYLPISAPTPYRIHGAFVSDEEVASVASHLKEANDGEGESLDFSRIAVQVEAGMSSNGTSDAERDPLYDEAVENVINSQRASISLVQRQLRIGYNRAARMIEAMEAAGLVSPPDQTGTRKVLAGKPPTDN